MAGGGVPAPPPPPPPPPSGGSAGGGGGGSLAQQIAAAKLKKAQVRYIRGFTKGSFTRSIFAVISSEIFFL
jgi:hypothetical protein